jgi:hypothetical protein
VLIFLARANSEADESALDDDDSTSDVQPTDFVRLRETLAEQVLRSVRYHGTWPELLRRVAHELSYDDRVTLRSLRFSEYPAIDLAQRLRLLAFVCDAAASTLTARRLIESRMQRVDAAVWDWQARRHPHFLTRVPSHPMAIG